MGPLAEATVAIPKTALQALKEHRKAQTTQLAGSPGVA